jgi:hypothetical protein
MVLDRLSQVGTQNTSRGGVQIAIAAFPVAWRAVNGGETASFV